MKDIDYYELGKRIQLRRKELGLSQEAAAEQCGISPSFYSNIERGIKIMSLETFVSICKAFSISADYLLNDELPVIDEVVFNTIQEAKNPEPFNMKSTCVQFRLSLLLLITYSTYKKEIRQPNARSPFILFAAA